MRHLFSALLAALLVLPAAPMAGAHTIQAGDLMLIHPNARPNLPNRPAVVYVTISNDGAAPDRLLGAHGPDFTSAELHQSKSENGVASMARVKSIDLPPGETVELAPGGYHLMLFGAKKLFKAGDMFPLTLTFEKAGDVAVEVMVQKIGSGEMDHSQMSMPKTGN